MFRPHYPEKKGKGRGKGRKKGDGEKEMKKNAEILKEIVDRVCEPVVTAAKKKRLKKTTRGDCVFQSTSPSVTDNKDHYPINSLAQARNALARVMQHDGSPSWYKGSLAGLQKAVKRAVYAKYPGLKSRKEEREGKAASDRSAIGESWGPEGLAPPGQSPYLAEAPGGSEDDGSEADIHVWAKPGDEEEESATYTVSVGPRALCVDMPLDEAVEAARGYMEEMV